MSAGQDRTGSLVWIDSREAIIVRWADGHEEVGRLESDVPVHRRITGDGLPQQSVEGQRLEHLARFVESVAHKLPADDDLLIVGSGPVREHLLNKIEQMDALHHATRKVACHAERRLTVPQLVARLRHEIGEEPLRRKVGRRRPPVARRPSRREEEREFAELLAEEEI